MELFSVLGRFLFAWFFVSSAWQTLKEIDTDIRLVEKEYVVKLAGFLDLLVHYSEETKIQIVHFFITFFIGLKAIGGSLFLFDRIEGTFLLILYLLTATPILYDFYHYKVGEPEFFLLLHDFMQNVAFFGALLFFIEMKITLFQRQPKKKASMFKTT
uniref:Uncharacterized protein n=3 Tax=Nicotiana TaxID=4085 RepID=A0A1S3ZI23_TOBAC|nr:PREDICTED: uncharacterized protein LOC104222987 [Nicotiana sylvestris]XP_016463907.1 PREDICTED: uncharacterized protein LOC107786907 [Nicotiana tabacum]